MSLRAVGRRLSQRGAALLVLGAVDFIYAYGLAYVPPETASSPTYTFLAVLLPLPAWAGIWALVGAVCLVQAWSRRDRFAYTLATALKVGWALLHLVAWIFGVLPRGYVLAAIWLLGAALVMILATVPRPGIEVADDA